MFGLQFNAKLAHDPRNRDIKHPFGIPLFKFKARKKDIRSIVDANFIEKRNQLTTSYIQILNDLKIFY